jgi:probable F420-dependent oxidoreductase
MKVGAYVSASFGHEAADAQRLQDEGFDPLWIAETKSDPFLRTLLAAQGAQRSQIATGIAIAFARSPMTLAYTSYDLARFTQGRFVLGIGSQVKAHVELRFSMPWTNPIQRMEEYVKALRAIWRCWHEGVPLAYNGEIYRHRLMTPMFTPERHQWGPPPVYLAAVGERMTEVAGEVGDGYLFHAFTTARYLQEVSLPALAAGHARAGRSDPITVTGPALVATGRTVAEVEQATRSTRERLAFYASTPAYRAVLDLHGWGHLQPELAAMAKRGEWQRMGRLVPDDLLHAMAVVGPSDRVAEELHRRWAGVADSITLYAPYVADPTLWPPIARELRAATSERTSR